MKTQRFFYLLIFSTFFSFAQAQTTAPNSREPEKKRTYYAPARAKATKFHKTKITHTKEYEFYERVEKAAKQRQRNIKKYGAPQYSDPRYFGHKHIPKRKSAHKMRYCNECGIRH